MTIETRNKYNNWTPVTGLDLSYADRSISYHVLQIDDDTIRLSTTFPQTIASSGRVLKIPETISRTLSKKEINQHGPADKPWRWIPSSRR